MSKKIKEKSNIVESKEYQEYRQELSNNLNFAQDCIENAEHLFADMECLSYSRYLLDTAYDILGHAIYIVEHK